MLVQRVVGLELAGATNALEEAHVRQVALQAGAGGRHVLLWVQHGMRSGTVRALGAAAGRIVAHVTATSQPRGPGLAGIAGARAPAAPPRS